MNSTENCHFYSREKSLYVAWACFRNDNDRLVTDVGLFEPRCEKTVFRGCDLVPYEPGCKVIEDG